jgi:hypothetical protein
MQVERTAKRRRREETRTCQHLCHHCGRVFKRLEHLERHVRTRTLAKRPCAVNLAPSDDELTTPDTKEKPFVCRCGAAFTRRDLLSRHQKIAQQDDGDTGTHETALAPGFQLNCMEAGTKSTATAEAASLSGISMDSWDPQARLQITGAYPPAAPPAPQPAPPVGIPPYHQPPIAQDFFSGGENVPRLSRLA